jgi:hypothetical protein
VKHARPVAREIDHSCQHIHSFSLLLQEGARQGQQAPTGWTSVSQRAILSTNRVGLRSDSLRDRESHHGRQRQQQQQQQGLQGLQGQGEDRERARAPPLHHDALCRREGVEWSPPVPSLQPPLFSLSMYGGMDGWMDCCCCFSLLSFPPVWQSACDFERGKTSKHALHFDVWAVGLGNPPESRGIRDIKGSPVSTLNSESRALACASSPGIGLSRNPPLTLTIVFFVRIPE